MNQNRRLKRVIDVGVAAALLTLGSPIVVGVAGLVLVFYGWPPVFIQRRPGLHGKPFNIFKFRTMTNERDTEGNLLPDEQRLTRFGELLRTTSLDELPELINVLRGEMSLVGPRPLLMQYLQRYSTRQARRHNVPPGITGWSAVHGRNSIDWDTKLELDVWYVENWSNALDIEILLRTVATVLSRKGVAAEGSATMPEFRGVNR